MLFERFFTQYKKFDHPEDMKKIIEYLESIGRLYISYKEVEDYYYRYSDSVCCGWRIVDEDSLEEFTNYLENYERNEYLYRDEEC